MVLTGVTDGMPTTLVDVDERVVAYAVGDPLLGKIVEAYARRRLKAQPAFQGAALRGLEPTSFDDAPVAAFAPGPFVGKWERGAGGLLAGATAISAFLYPKGVGRALLELDLQGDFGAGEAVERLRAAYAAIAASSTGTLLNLGANIDSRVTAASDRLTLRVPLPLTEVARGARAATVADVDEIFRLSPTSEGQPDAPSSPDSR